MKTNYVGIHFKDIPNPHDVVPGLKVSHIQRLDIRKNLTEVAVQLCSTSPVQSGSGNRQEFDPDIPPPPDRKPEICQAHNSRTFILQHSAYGCDLLDCYLSVYTYRL